MKAKDTTISPNTEKMLTVMQKWVSSEITTEEADRQLNALGVKLPVVRDENT